MDAEGLSCFKRIVAASRCYLEYGAGGSTVYACVVAEVPAVISVESDPVWRDQVLSAVAPCSSDVCIELCDIGEVGKWGRPSSSERIGDYWRYMALPWEAARQRGYSPDMVLIDGRFRVASFLYSLVSSRDGTCILFDDYFDRPEYSVVEEFCPVSERCGRMGVFVVSGSPASDGIIARIAQYSIVPN